ncbi:germ cell-less protein-like 1 [Nannospalax galili]|uniref:germ cell-less protein-like 1 n=1 Tax=Nannospalax galili TaxID=1026970 RepID=UPI00111C2402|nr:germ cell-less protein-like 1 [Nannospalax galili]
MNVKTVCGCYTSSGTCGLDSVKKNINIMKQLIGSSNIFVMQVEMDVYTALKKLVPSRNGSLKQLLTETDVWFSKRVKRYI